MSSRTCMDFQAYLRAERPAVVDELSRELAPLLSSSARGAFTPAEIAEQSFDLFFAATWERSPEETKRLIAESFEARSELRPLLEGVQARVATLHGVFVRHAELAAKAGVEGVWDGVLRMSAAHGAIAAGLAEAFQTSLRAAHEALSRSEHRYRRLFESAPVMMHARDSQYRICAVSDRWIEETGYSREEIIGQPTIRYLTEETQRMAREVYRKKFAEQGYARDDHYQIIKKDGEVMDVLASSVSAPDEQELGESVIVMVDVTERMKTERALRESEARHRILIERMPFGIMVHRGGKVLYVNPAAAALFGAETQEELVGVAIAEFVHPDFVLIMKERVRRAETEGRSSPVIEEKLLRRDGSVFYAEVMTTQIPYDGGTAVHAMFTDVTARKLAQDAERRAAVQEELIRAQARLLSELLTPLLPIHDGVVVMPLIGRIDEARGERILEALLEGITAHQATCAILDMTGVPEAQEGVAEGLVRAAQAARMLGAQVILTGMKPSIAQALVQMGAALSGIVTRGTLRSGVAYALQALKRR